MLILDHAIKPHKLVVECCQLLWGLAIIESWNARDSQIERVFDPKLLLKDGCESLSLFLAALGTLFFTFTQNGEDLLIKCV